MMKRMFTRLVRVDNWEKQEKSRVDNWEKQEKSFVIAMMLMVVFNFACVVFMLNK